MWGVSITPEGKIRNEAKELIGDNMNAELVPFPFTHKDGGEEIKPSPMAYVPNLWEKIQCLLEQNQDDHKGYLLSHKHQKYSTDKHNHCAQIYMCRIHRITWHNGAIPEDEVWLKMVGDKGGGTFKFGFQYLNVGHPNSPDNTCIFALFEAPDTYTNLRICLEKYKHDIEDLQSHTWR